jgi:hypothetical protein
MSKRVRASRAYVRARARGTPQAGTPQAPDLRSLCRQTYSPRQPPAANPFGLTGRRPCSDPLERGAR